MLLAMGSAVATPANYAAYSFDGGNTFAACVVPDPAGGLFGGAYSPSLGYGIIVSATGEVFRSFDGITWAALAGNDLTNGNWQGGVIRNGDDSLFVTTGLGGTDTLRAATSPDGVTWTLRTTPTGTFGSVCRISPNGKIVACGAGGIIRSLDGGITWAAITSAGDTNSDIAYRENVPDYLHVAGNDLTNGNWQGGVIRNGDDSLFVTTGLGGTDTLRAATSPDGVTWTLRTTPTGTFGSVCRISSNGKIVACGAGGIIRSLDGGITWAAITSAGDTNSDIAYRENVPDYLHVAGNTSADAGDTYFSSNFGGAWTRMLRDALNDPPNLQAIAIDPLRGHVYQGGATGIWRGNCNNPNNPPNLGWTNVYAGAVGSGCRAGYLVELDKIIFVDHSGSAGFQVHQNTLSEGVWSTQDYPLLLVNTARVRLQFLGFPPP